MVSYSSLHLKLKLSELNSLNPTNKQTKLAGMESETPVRDEADFVARVMAREMQVFSLCLEEKE